MLKTAFVLGLLGGASLLSAQEFGRGRGPQFPRFAASLDKDRDGTLSAPEIAAATDTLKALDRNTDGQLTADELIQQPGPGGRRGGRPEGRGEGNAAQEVIDTYMGFDKNSDGKLAKEELPERMQGVFERGDTNKDTVLTKDELTAMAKAQVENEGRGRGPRGGFNVAAMLQNDPAFRALDTDNNGTLSADEMKSASSSLKKLDKSGDGLITADEYSPAPIQ